MTAATDIRGGVKPDSSPWPAWVRHTISAALGGGIAIVGVVVWLDAVRNDAANARVGVADHETRLRVLEQRRAEDSEALKSLTKMLDETRADVKEILRRTSK